MLGEHEEEVVVADGRFLRAVNGLRALAPHVVLVVLLELSDDRLQLVQLRGQRVAVFDHEVRVDGREFGFGGGLGRELVDRARQLLEFVETLEARREQRVDAGHFAVRVDMDADVGWQVRGGDRLAAWRDLRRRFAAGGGTNDETNDESDKQ